MLRRNEVLAREGIDTDTVVNGDDVDFPCRNEVLAREGIDTYCLIASFTWNSTGRNEVLAREGIDTTVWNLNILSSFYE